MFERLIAETSAALVAVPAEVFDSRIEESIGRVTPAQGLCALEHAVECCDAGVGEVRRRIRGAKGEV